MPVPAVLKSGPVLTSFGVLGTGAVGVGGWQLIEGIGSTNSSMYMPFHNGNVPNLGNLGIKAETSSVSDWGKSYDCFSGFFKGVSFKHTQFSEIVQTLNPSDKENLKINPTSSKWQEKPVGCAMFQLSQKLDKKKPYWTLRAEVTAKNEKVGWSLWIVGDGSVKKESDTQFQYQQSLEYRLVFLEWENSKWNIKGGYHWNDPNLVLNDVFNIKVVVPGEGGELINKKCEDDNANDEDDDTEEDSAKEPLFNGFVDNAKAELKGFSGIWEASPDGKEGEEVFKEVYVSNIRDSKEYGIFGKSGGFSDSEIKATAFYKPEESKWVNYKESAESFNYHKIDIKDVLDKWYEPFKGKKGKWKKLNDGA